MLEAALGLKSDDCGCIVVGSATWQPQTVISNPERKHHTSALRVSRRQASRSCLRPSLDSCEGKHPHPPPNHGGVSQSLSWHAYTLTWHAYIHTTVADSPARLTTCAAPSQGGSSGCRRSAPPSCPAPRWRT